MNRRSFLTALAALPSCFTAAAAALRSSQLTVSTACLSGLTFAEALKTIREMGFSGVEILTFSGQKHSVGPIPGVELIQLTSAEKNQLRGEVARFERVTTHLPFHGLLPAASDRSVRKATLDRLHRAVDDSGFWGARLAVAHAAAEPNLSYEKVRPDLITAFRDLGDHASRYKMRIGIETGYPNTVTDYLSLIREINHEFVGGTVDTGHTRAYRVDIGVADSERATPKGARRYNDILMQKVEGLGPKLFHFHVDDVRPSDWREHRTLGSGLVDWTRLLRHLAQVGYQGNFAIELEEVPPREELQKSKIFFESVVREVV